MDEPQSKNLIPINICTFAIKIVPRLNIISGSATGTKYVVPSFSFFLLQKHNFQNSPRDVCVISSIGGLKSISEQVMCNVFVSEMC